MPDVVLVKCTFVFLCALTCRWWWQLLLYLIEHTQSLLVCSLFRTTVLWSYNQWYNRVRRRRCCSCQHATARLFACPALTNDRDIRSFCLLSLALSLCVRFVPLYAAFKQRLRPSKHVCQQKTVQKNRTPLSDVHLRSFR